MISFTFRSLSELPKSQKRLRRRVRRVRCSRTQRSRARTSSDFLIDALGAASLDKATTCVSDVADSVSVCAQQASVASDVGEQQGSPAPAFDSTELADVLPYLLSRTLQLDLDIHDVCSILCCCSEYANIVEHHCTGSLGAKLPDPCHEAAMDSFVYWLPRHGNALQSLVVGDLSLTSSLRAEGQDSPVFLSLALPAIAASCCGWRLQQYISTSPDSSAPIILEQLPPSHLTHLQITLPEDSQCPGVSEAFSIIGQLRKLARLQIISYDPAIEQSDDSCLISLSALGSLKHLTTLHLDRVMSFSGLGELQHLPPSVQDLRISCPADSVQCDEHLDLGHMTALCSLSFHSGNCYCLMADDILPACLRSVRIGNCNQIQPLLGLTELQELWLTNTPHTELAQVTALTTLTKLALTYDSPVPTLYLGVWADLAALREVTLTNCLIKIPELKLIGQIRGLTRLCMVFCSYETTVHELVLALKQLTNLQGLVLDSKVPDVTDGKYLRAPNNRPYGLDWPIELTVSSDEPRAADAPILLLECVTEMVNCHKLRSLHLDLHCDQLECDGFYDPRSLCLEFDCGKYAAVLAKATALTRLSIGGNIMSASWGLSTYVARLTNLCSLQLVGDGWSSDTAVGLSDAGLKLLAQSLTKLTHLDISESKGCTTTAGLGVLTGLKQLRSLRVLGIAPRVLRRLGLPTTYEHGNVWCGVPDSRCSSVGSTSECRWSPPW